MVKLSLLLKQLEFSLRISAWTFGCKCESALFIPNAASEVRRASYFCKMCKEAKLNVCLPYCFSMARWKRRAGHVWGRIAGVCCSVTPALTPTVTVCPYHCTAPHTIVVWRPRHNINTLDPATVHLY